MDRPWRFGHTWFSQHQRQRATSRKHGLRDQV